MSAQRTIIILGIVSLLLMIGIGGAVWWFFIRSPSAPQCKPPSDNLTCLTTGNLAAIEDKLSKKVETPSQTLIISKFGAAGGAPWCIPTWYALRYIDGDGNYGDLGPWSSEVVAGKHVSGGGCSANLPQLEPENIITFASQSSGYNTNIHRQYQKLDTSSEGEIVGMLNDEYFYIDQTSNNPNYDYIKSVCKGCHHE